VSNKDREPISSVLMDTSKARLSDYKWHKIKVTRNTSIGLTLYVKSVKNVL